VREAQRRARARALAHGRALRPPLRQARLFMKVALAGDTMLGRRVAEELGRRPPQSLVDPELAEITRGTDLFVLNLECCISERGEPVEKTFNFRAPLAAVETLLHLGVDCVTLANNHALDYGIDALLDTCEHLREAGIVYAGAGEDVDQARAPAVVGGLPIFAFADHQASFAAGRDRPGIAFADLRPGVPGWIRERAPGALVCPHWGPTMTPPPRRSLRRGALGWRERAAGPVPATPRTAFQGVAKTLLYDIADFLD